MGYPFSLRGAGPGRRPERSIERVPVDDDFSLWIALVTLLSLARPARERHMARVHEIARDYGLESKEVLRHLSDLGEFVKSAAARIAPPVERRLRARLG